MAWKKQLCIRVLPGRWLCLPSFKTFNREELEVMKLLKGVDDKMSAKKE